MRSSRLSRTVVGTLVLLLPASACQDTTAPQFRGPAPLPSIESMLTDLSLFEVERPGAEGNYSAAAAEILAARATTIVAMPLPVLIYNGARATDPRAESDGYHWIYLVTEGSQTFDVNLTGRARGVVDAVWEMRVTSSTLTPALTNFLLFSGVSRLDTVSGSWRIFDPSVPSTQTAALDVSWSNEGNSWRIVFTNIRSDSPNLNDHLEFESTTDLRRVQYFDASAGKTVIVQWNTTSREGYILSPTLNNGLRACWNTLFKNTTCLI